MLRPLFFGTRPSEPFRPDPDPAASPRLPYIVVPASAAKAAETDPERLLSAVGEFVEFVTGQAQFQRGEFPQAALQAYHCNLYRTQVLRGGHSWFIRRTMQTLPEVLGDTGRALRAVGADAHRALYDRMQKWIATNPKGITTLTGFVRGIAPELAALDEPFRQVDATDSLALRLARWIQSQPEFRTVADDEWAATLQKLLSWNPERERRRIASGIAGADQCLTDPNHVGLGMAAASMEPPEPPIRIGSAWHLPVDADHVAPAHWMRTTAGHRFGVVLEDGYALFEAHPEPAAPRDDGLPDELRKVPDDSIDEIQFQRPHRLGRRLATVAAEDAELAGRVCRRLHAAAAIHLLLTRLAQRATVAFAAVHRIRRAVDGGPEVVIMIVADHPRRGYSAVVNTDGARLLAEPGHGELARASRVEINAHARAATRG